MTREEFLIKLREETVYLKNEFEKAVIKSTPDGKAFVKFKGVEPYEATNGASIVVNVCYEENEITKEEYDSF